jgi:hypothetical protein
VSPASGTGVVREPRLMSQVARDCVKCARRSVFFCSQSGVRASIVLLT